MLIIKFSPQYFQEGSDESETNKPKKKKKKPNKSFNLKAIEF